MPGSARTNGKRGRLHIKQPRRKVLGSPAAFAPFVDVGLLFAEGRVVAVAWVEPGVVGQDVKDPRRDVVDQRIEI
jgi:hypothetical protein